MFDFLNFFKILANKEASRKSMRIFVTVILFTVGLYLLGAIAVTGALISRANNAFNRPSLELPSFPEGPDFNLDNPPLVDVTFPEQENDETFLRPPPRVNILIIGIDEQALADTIIIATFERDTGIVDLISIPRDTYTQLPQSRINAMTGMGIWVPNDGVMKINALRAYGRNPSFIIEHITETLGINIHYYVEVDISMFRQVVDIIGGVEIEVARRMYYWDPDQDLLIDIPPGVHLMNGEMAEQFVRYRSFDSGDTGRMSNQQIFLIQLASQSLRREIITSNLVSIASLIIENVNTNITIGALRLLPYITSVRPELMNMHILPGENRLVNGLWYFIPNPEETAELIREIFSFGEVKELPNAINPLLRIAVQNGTPYGGVAMNVADRLRAAGYDISDSNIGWFNGPSENRTRIFVKEEANGNELARFFENASVFIDDTIEFDALIIVGRSEALTF